MCKDLGNQEACRVLGPKKEETVSTVGQRHSGGRWQRWHLFFVALPASCWIRDYLINLSHHIYSNSRGSQTPTSPFISTTFNTAWRHYRVLSGLAIHSLTHPCWKIPHFVTLGNVTICTEFLNQMFWVRSWTREIGSEDQEMAVWSWENLGRKSILFVLENWHSPYSTLPPPPIYENNNNKNKNLHLFFTCIS